MSPTDAIGEARCGTGFFAIDRQGRYPYVPRHFGGGDAASRERIAQPVEQLTFNQ
jgi:hypothetical protein